MWPRRCPLDQAARRGDRDGQCVEREAYDDERRRTDPYGGPGERQRTGYRERIQPDQQRPATTWLSSEGGSQTNAGRGSGKLELAGATTWTAQVATFEGGRRRRRWNGSDITSLNPTTGTAGTLVTIATVGDGAPARLSSMVRQGRADRLERDKHYGAGAERRVPVATWW